VLDGQRVEVTPDAEVRTRSAFVEMAGGSRAGLRLVVPLENFDPPTGRCGSSSTSSPAGGR